MAFVNPSSAIRKAPLQYTLPAGGALVNIPATIFARRVQIWEDGSVAAFAGFSLLYPNGVTVAYTPDQQPAIIDDSVLNRGGMGNFLYVPAQEGYPGPRAADLYCQASSQAGTVINVWEEE
jgi:hypothetical protein